MLIAMANEFAHRNWRVHVVCLSKAGELAIRLREAVTLHVLNKRRGLDLMLPVRLQRTIGQIAPDVINSHLWVANAWTRLSLLGNSIPIIATEHSRDVWKPFHYRWMDKFLSRRTYQLVAVSEDAADFYRSTIAIRDELITVIHNGVDTALYSEGKGLKLREKWLNVDSSISEDCSVLIGTVGRLVPAKNHFRLLESIAFLRRDKALSEFHIRLKIVGEGPERSRIQQRIDQLHLADAVSLAGTRHDIPDVLAAFDIFVLSSDREGHPLTALEAQAAGTPVVLTDAGGSGETIAHDASGVGGVLVEKNARAIAVAIREMLLDPQLRQRRAAFARHYAHTHFDKQTMIDRYERLFMRSLAARD